MRVVIKSLLLLVIFVAACSTEKTPDSIFENYQYRLSNSLDVDQGTVSDQKFTRYYPHKKQLLLEIPLLNMDLLDFLKLSQCNLQRLLGERNSSMGRMSGHSQRLLYDARFIPLAKECIEQLKANNGSSELISQLRLALEHKEKYWLNQFFNATFAGQEFIHLFSLSAEPLTIAESQSPPNRLYDALESINLAKDRKQLNADTFESLLAIVGSQEYVGQLRQSMALVNQHIDAANQLLDYRLNEQPLCPNLRPNEQSKIMHKVFLKFYIGEIQPYIAKVYQQSSKVFGLLDQLQEGLPVPDSFAKFWHTLYQSDESEWYQFQIKVADHTKRWQKLLAQCGLQPGQ